MDTMLEPTIPYPYKYTPLALGEIRLVKLLPYSGNETDPISCQLFHFSIDNLPTYQALSYTWDNEVPSALPSRHRIYVDDKTLEIMPNLEAFLLSHRLQHSTPESQTDYPLIWIDAICINQDDLVERVQQIRMMCRLYSGLSRLIVWLGSDDEDSKIAIQFLKTIAQKIGQEGEESLKPWAEELASSPDFVPVYFAVRKFFCRSWFARSWIVQEYVLGSRAFTVFQCGSDFLAREEMESWHKFRGSYHWMAWKDAPHFASSASLRNRISFSEGHIRWTALSLACRYQSIIKFGQFKSTLLYWLSLIRAQEATDPRDKIYSALGLLEACQTQGHLEVIEFEPLIIDYEASLQDIYSSVVRSIVLATKSLFILLSCIERGPSIQRTWTPDWSVHVICPGFFGTVAAHYYEASSKVPFCAAADTDATAIFSEDLTTMMVRGFVWDTVRILSPLPVQVDQPIISLPPSVSLAKIFVEFCLMMLQEETTQRIYGGEGVRRSIWRSLLSKEEGRQDLENRMIVLGIDDKLVPNPYTSKDEEGEEHKGRDMELQGSRGSTPAHPQAYPSSNYTAKLFTPKFLARFENRGLATDNLFLTTRGYIGKDVTSGHVQAGDLICVLLGCPVPVALRKVGDKYEFVRSVWLDGIMYGEALNGENVELRNFELC